MVNLKSVNYHTNNPVYWNKKREEKVMKYYSIESNGAYIFVKAHNLTDAFEKMQRIAGNHNIYGLEKEKVKLMLTPPPFGDFKDYECVIAGVYKI